MKLKIKWVVNQSEGIETFPLDDLGVSIEEWNKLNEEERQELMYETLPDVFWPVIDSYDLEEQ